MKKYRIIRHTEDGKRWFTVQRKGFFFWHTLQRDSGYELSDYVFNDGADAYEYVANLKPYEKKVVFEFTL